VWENVDLNWIWGSVDSFVNDPDAWTSLLPVQLPSERQNFQAKASFFIHGVPMRIRAVLLCPGW
jgi:hypothetical protein